MAKTSEMLNISYCGHELDQLKNRNSIDLFCMNHRTGIYTEHCSFGFEPKGHTSNRQICLACLSDISNAQKLSFFDGQNDGGG